MIKPLFIKAIALFAFSYMILGTSVMAACAAAGDGGMGVALTQGMLLGKLTAPDADAGSASVIIKSTDGSRTLPPELRINTQNTDDFGDVFQPAIVKITGAADCDFKIEVSGFPSSVSNIKLTGTSGTSLSGDTSGATGTLSASGEAFVQIGASVSVNSANTSDISVNFDADVTCVDTAC